MAHQSDHSEFTQLYKAQKRALFNYLMYRTNFNRQQAEDLFMDVILKAYENFPKFDPQKGSFKSWLFSIAHNHLLNYWRDNKEAISIEKIEEKGRTIAKIAPNKKLAQQEIDRCHINDVLKKLPKKDRTIITLRYLKQLKTCEIAKLLHKKTGAIRTQLCRALSKCKNIYLRIYPPQ